MNSPSTSAHVPDSHSLRTALLCNAFFSGTLGTFLRYAFVGNGLSVLALVAGPGWTRRPLSPQISGKPKRLAWQLPSGGRSTKSFFINALIGSLALSSALHAAPLRVQGSTTVNPVVAEAAESLRAERSLTVQVDTLGGSSGGLKALGEGRVEVAMSSKPVTDADRARHPAVAFNPVRIGEDAVALIVSHDVWEGGLRSVTREQLQGIYERRITNWKALGGPDRRIVFFNKEPGRGTWEVFATWLYGKASAAPLVAHPEVGANEEARSKVAGTRGALSQLSFSWVDGKTIHALGIRADEGSEPVFPSAATIRDGHYPLSRPLLVVTAGEPAGAAKELIDYLLSAPGQALVRKHGYLTLADLAAEKTQP